MVKNNIIIAFSSEKICNKVSNVLYANGIMPNFICKSATNLRKVCSYLENGTIICNTNFPDEFINNIIEDFNQTFNFILIDKIESINIFDDAKVYKLSTPIKPNELVCAVNICLYQNSEKIKSQKDEVILKAKNILMEKYNLTEKQAHKYIQNKSMSTNQKSTDIAKKIIKRFD